jgi:hypothetical protein
MLVVASASFISMSCSHAWVVPEDWRINLVIVAKKSQT